MHQTPTDKKVNDKVKIINRGLAAIARILVGENENRRQKGLSLLATAPSAVALRLVEKLVIKLQRGSDDVRQRAQAALIAAGMFAVPAVALAAIKSRDSRLHFAAISVLLGIGLELHDSERLPVFAALFEMLRTEKEKPVREAAMDALMTLHFSDPRPGLGPQSSAA